MHEHAESTEKLFTSPNLCLTQLVLDAVRAGLLGVSAQMNITTGIKCRCAILNLVRLDSMRYMYIISKLHFHVSSAFLCMKFNWRLLSSTTRTYIYYKSALV